MDENGTSTQHKKPVSVPSWAAVAAELQITPTAKEISGKQHHQVAREIFTYANEEGDRKQRDDRKEMLGENSRVEGRANFSGWTGCFFANGSSRPYRITGVNAYREDGNFPSMPLLFSCSSPPSPRRSLSQSSSLLVLRAPPSARLSSTFSLIPRMGEYKVNNMI
jgi:hypothetical protein